MKRNIKTYSFSLMWLTLTNICYAGPSAVQKYDYDLMPVDSWISVVSHALDWNGDGIDEILDLNYFGNGTLKAQDGKCNWSYNFGLTHDDGWFYLRQYIGSEKLGIFMLSQRRGDSIYLHIREKRAARNVFISYRAKAVDRPDPGGSGYFLFPSIHNLNGRKIIIGYWNTNFTLSHPRGLAAYDFYTGQEVWHYWLGGTNDDEIHLCDVNNDGRQELIFSTGAASNGGRANDTDDSHTYVFCFNINGMLLWKKSVGLYFSRLNVRIVDYNDDGQKEILCWEISHRDKQNMERPDVIYLFKTIDGGLIKKVSVGEFIKGGDIGDIDNDGKDEFIVGNSDSRIRVYSLDLEKEAEYIYPIEIPIDVIAVRDINNDGYHEIVAMDRNSRLVILNHKLKDILTKQIKCHPDKVFMVKNGKTYNILTADLDNRTEHKWTLWKFQQLPIYSRSYFGTYLSIASMVAIIIMLILLYLMRREVEIIKKGIKDLTRPGLIYIDGKKRIIFINSKASALLGLNTEKPKGKKLLPLLSSDSQTKWKDILECQTLPQIHSLSISRDETVKHLEITQNHTDYGRVIVIEDITDRENVQRAKDWATMAQQMAHGIKTPLTTILLAVQKIGRLSVKKNDAGEVSTLCDTIEEEITRLRKSSDGLMKFLSLEPPQKEPVDVRQFIQNVLKRFELNSENGIEFQANFNDKLPIVYFDKRLMEMALDNIIENAVSSIEKNGKVEIDVTLSDKIFANFRVSKAVKIEITDNGPGIALAYKNKLFKPFFTTKENGTGLGLITTKRIIEDHEGQIEIDSKEKIGTVVSIYLPVLG